MSQAEQPRPQAATGSLKRRAALRALEAVGDGMMVGLGTGSTTAHFIRGLGRRIAREGLNVQGVPTSRAAETLARQAHIPLVELDPDRPLDVTVDGADEVDPNLDLIKGLGGALVREKVVAAHSRLHITVVDDTKLVKRLGTRSPLPVEVVTFGHTVTRAQLEGLGCRARLRRENDGRPYVTDNGNHIYHCHFPAGIEAARQLEGRLLDLPGVVQTGFFLGLTHRVLVAGAGGVRELRRELQREDLPTPEAGT